MMRLPTFSAPLSDRQPRAVGTIAVCGRPVVVSRSGKRDEIGGDADRRIAEQQAGDQHRDAVAHLAPGGERRIEAGRDAAAASATVATSGAGTGQNRAARAPPTRPPITICPSPPRLIMPPRSGIAATSVMPTSGVAQFSVLGRLPGAARRRRSGHRPRADWRPRRAPARRRRATAKRIASHRPPAAAAAAARSARRRARSRGLRRPPRHQEAERLLVGLAPRHSATMRPSYITSTRSVSARISLSSAETSSTARPLSRSARSWPWMNSVAPTSTPRVGCSAISSRRLVREFARDHDLLQVAAGERADGRARSLRSGCRTRRISARARAGDRRRVDQPAARERRPALEAHRQIVGGAGRERGADGGAILGDIGEARRAMRGDVGAGHVDAADAHAPAVGRAQADQRLDELALAVAGDAGDADDLAGAHRERRRGRPAACRAAPATVSSTASSSGAPGCAGALSTLRLTLRPVMARTISRARGLARSSAARRRARRAARSRGR